MTLVFINKIYKILRIRNLIGLLFITTASNLLSQAEQVFRHLQKKDGLSHSNVFAITQDGDGYVWFGTRDGLNRYDGHSFKVYRHNPKDDRTVVSNDVRRLYYEKSTGILWIGTFQGLSKYDASSDQFTTFTSDSRAGGLSSNVIRCIYGDSRANLWVGTKDGLNFRRKNSEGFNTILLPTQVSISALYEDPDGNLLLGTNKGLYIIRLSGSTDNEVVAGEDYNSLLSEIKHTSISSINLDGENNIWIGTVSHGLFKWNKLDNEIINYTSTGTPGSLSNDNIRVITHGPEGKIWVGTFNGLNEYDKATGTFIVYKQNDYIVESLSNNSIRSIFFDTNNGMWIGTYHGGVNYSDPMFFNFKNYQKLLNKNSLSNNIVSSFAEDKKGNIWIGTEGGGLNYWNQQSNTYSNYQHTKDCKNCLSGNNVKAVLVDEEIIWIGTYNAGLNRYNTKTKEFFAFKDDQGNQNGIIGNNVYGLLAENNRIWSICHSAGLSILDITTNKFYNYSSNDDDEYSLNSNSLRAILKDRKGRIWIGSEKGLDMVIRNTIQDTLLGFETRLTDLNIYSIHEDKKTAGLWLGTFGEGLVFYDPENNSTSYYNSTNGLTGDNIFGIMQDENDFLWISTNNGINRIDVNNNNIDAFTANNGLANDTYNYNAFLKLSNGNLIFGGTQGYSMFDPDHIKITKNKAPVVFTALKIHNKIVEVNEASSPLSSVLNRTDELIFKHNEANFTLCFTSLDFLNASNRTFAYRLEGLDQEWNYSVGPTEATYTLQREGNYTFLLKSMDDNGNWEIINKNLSIKVLPVFWRNPIAYFLYALFIGGLIWAIFRYIKLQHRLELKQVSVLREKELNEEKFKFFTNITHEFRTPLTLIFSPLEELIRKYPSEQFTPSLLNIRRNTKRLLNLVNQILVFRKMEQGYAKLQVQEQDIIVLLKDVFDSFSELAKKNLIEYTFEHNPKDKMTVWYDSDKLEKVFFNLLSNAFKFTPVGGKIELVVRKAINNVEISVSDSGPGIAQHEQDEIFKRFYEKTSGSRSQINSSGIGLALSKQMIELHNGEINVSSALDIGTTFMVKIPFGNKHFSPAHIQSNNSIAHQHPAVYQKNLVQEKLALQKQLLIGQSEEIAKKSQILIAEDNDEIRQLLISLFADAYIVHQAINGIEALNLIKKENIDLVISDIMMPEMDGNILCKKIKTAISSSHIPVILLTARNRDDDKIDSLKYGADDYITKPFHPEELKIRVENLLRSRKKLREQFVRVVNIEPKEITVTSADEDFLQRAIEIAEKNIDYTRFTVDQFAHELAVSRPLLFKKLKAITGQTPNNFIKSIRLKRAAQLLSQNKLQVAEIAYKVGFKDSKYFSKCFQQQYGKSPTAYAKGFLPASIGQ